MGVGLVMAVLNNLGKKQKHTGNTETDLAFGDKTF